MDEQKIEKIIEERRGGMLPYVVQQIVVNPPEDQGVLSIKHWCVFALTATKGSFGGVEA